jgi:hypothetical protein
MLKPLLAFSLVLLIDAHADGARVAGAEIVEYGVFQKIASEGLLDAPKSLTGEINGVVEAKLLKQTPTITATVGTSFGIRVKITGESQDEIITCSFRWIRPKLTDPSSGKTTDRDEWQSQTRIGHARYAGYTFDEPWELVPGKWTLQVIYDSKVVAEKIFEVVLPANGSNQAIQPNRWTILSDIYNLYLHAARK